jgi:hypothetical protein
MIWWHQTSNRSDMLDYDWGLDLESKKKILQNRIFSIANNGYAIELNYRHSVEQNQEETAEKLRLQLEGVKAALKFHQNELNSLN